MNQPFEAKLTETVYVNGKVIKVDPRQKRPEQQISDERRMENYMKERARSVVQKRDS